ncbi:hypothetical protein APR12_001707 [Nocardia amikacinitolerans]|nr:hypothetical protein [Nocardia amikacinitolerans]
MYTPMNGYAAAKAAGIVKNRHHVKDPTGSPPSYVPAFDRLR